MRMNRCGLAAWAVLLSMTGGVWAQSDGPSELTYYQKVERAYIDGRWDDLEALLGQFGAERRNLNAQEISDITAMRRQYPNYRPRWWKATHASSEVKFRAGIWGRNFVANYRPSTAVGYQAIRAEGRYVNTKDGEKFVPTKLEVWVTWKASMVDSPKAGEGGLAKHQGLTEGHMAEAIVWHELGHNYVTEFIPMKSVVALYTDHRLLFSHLQEFYADLTAIYHGSPKARLNAMLFRLNELAGNGFSEYNRDSAHTRGAHAIGALFLAKVLEDPKAWPSIHLPPEVPEKDVELKLINYVYETIEPTWTFREDEAWREFVGDWVKKYGTRALRSKGQVQLPNDLEFRIMFAEDRENQEARNRWLAAKLKAAIASGRADKEAKKLGKRLYIPGYGPRIIIRTPDGKTTTRRPGDN